jgi:hypothetical protein
MTHAWIRRIASWASGGAVVAAMGGCSLFKSIQFTNVSDTWLNVRFYAGEPQPATSGPAELVSQRVFQIAPGESARFGSSRKLVHIQVETVTPTWEPPGTQYWLELMTHPPVHIVATGRASRLDFQTGSGEVAIIPERERKGGRFEYVIAERRRPEDGRPTIPAQQVAAPDK